VFFALMLIWTFSVPLFIVVAELAMWMAAAIWAARWVRGEIGDESSAVEIPEAGPAGDAFALIGAPIIAFYGASFLSAMLSRDQVESLWDLREVFLFVAPLVTYAAFRRPRLRRWGIYSFAAGIFVAVVWGYLQVAMSNGSGFRPSGPLSHYMTYAGVLMLAVPLLLAIRDKWRTIGLQLLAVLALAMVGLTMTRSAWLGCAAALLAFLACRLVPGTAGSGRARRPRWAAYGVSIVVGLIVIALLLLSFAGQEAIVERGASIFDPSNATNVDRLAMAATGLRLIANYPVLGIGPGLMADVYPAWAVEWAVRQDNPHLHNNVLQIAAERGLLGLALWLWMIAAFFVGAWRVLRYSGPHGEGGPEARAAIAALAGFLVMGMFEYNFSDSEVLMALLFILTLPIAASAGLAGSNGEDS
jgi:O-antigen ligase